MAKKIVPTVEMLAGMFDKPLSLVSRDAGKVGIVNSKNLADLREKSDEPLIEIARFARVGPESRVVSAEWMLADNTLTSLRNNLRYATRCSSVLSAIDLLEEWGQASYGLKVLSGLRVVEGRGVSLSQGRTHYSRISVLGGDLPRTIAARNAPIYVATDANLMDGETPYLAFQNVWVDKEWKRRWIVNVVSDVNAYAHSVKPVASCEWNDLEGLASLREMVSGEERDTPAAMVALSSTELPSRRERLFRRAVERVGANLAVKENRANMAAGKRVGAAPLLQMGTLKFPGNEASGYDNGLPIGYLTNARGYCGRRRSDSETELTVAEMRESVAKETRLNLVRVDYSQCSGRHVEMGYMGPDSDDGYALVGDPQSAVDAFQVLSVASRSWGGWEFSQATGCDETKHSYSVWNTDSLSWEPLVTNSLATLGKSSD